MLANTAIAQAAALIHQAHALVIAAGAGMGVDSGLPDFRGRDGFWRAYPALAQAGLDFQEIASPASFERDPTLAWGFYGHRLALYRATQPHEGFALLKRWGQAMRHGTTVFTSNVDGHFQRTGFEGETHECHGSLMHLQCARNCRQAIWPADGFEPDVDETTCRLRNSLPSCPHCGGLARPNVLMFSDGAWQPQRSDGQRRRQHQWLARAEGIVVVELGAGTAIPSVRHFSQGLVRQAGARLIRINPRECEVPSSSDVGLPMTAQAALRAIDAALRG